MTLWAYRHRRSILFALSLFAISGTLYHLQYARQFVSTGYFSQSRHQHGCRGSTRRADDG